MSNDIPTPSYGDSAHALAKAGLSLIPVVGGPAVELFQLVVQSPLDRRRSEWMAQVGERLQILEQEGLNLQKLQDNEQFITAVMRASAAAIKTHKEEKLVALRNAVLHVAVGQGPEETVQHMLLSLIDEFSEMHLRVLAFAHAPRPTGSISHSGLGAVLENNIPTLRGQQDLYDQLWKDLYLRGLVSLNGLHATMSGNGLSQSRTTSLGQALLDFIS